MVHLKDNLMEENKINRHGLCPHCQENWDGGDVFEALSKMDINMMKSPDDVRILAGNFGWSPDNPTNFSKTNVIELIPTPLMKLIYLQCPKCMYVYDAQTGKEYSSIQAAKSELVFDVMEELDKDDY